MFRILPPSGESSSLTNNSYGNNAGIVRRHERLDEESGTTTRPPSALRIYLAGAIGEFVGTFGFLFFAFALHMATVSQLPPDQPLTTIVILTICFAYSFFFGFWLLIYALTLPGMSSGLFNPAISLGLVLAGTLSASRAVFLLPVQVLAGVAAAAVVKAIVPGDLRRVETTLAPGVSHVHGMLLEMFTTSLLVIMAMVTVTRIGALSFMAPLGIGNAIFVASFVGIGFTGASMNPVRSLAPCAVNVDFPDYHWIYWAGPFLGALLPGIYVWLMKLLMRTNAPSSQGKQMGDGGVAEERSKMLPKAPTPPKIRKTTVTQVRSERSPDARSGSGVVYIDKDDTEAYYPRGMTTTSPPRSPYRSSREERRISSGRHSDMDRYSRARGYEEVMR